MVSYSFSHPYVHTVKYVDSVYKALYVYIYIYIVHTWPLEVLGLYNCGSLLIALLVSAYWRTERKGNDRNKQTIQ